MSEPPIYYLSPHADDVAFSCTGGVALDVAAGRQVTIITAFLSGKSAQQRQAEDEAAAAILGCAYKCLDLPDAPERPEVRGALDVFMPFGPRSLGITNEVMHRLLGQVPPCAELRVPLAVGGHIDHRIVHEAARALVYQLGKSVKLAYYEDLPYSLLPYSLGRRLHGLEPHKSFEKRDPDCERAAPAVELAACRRALSSWPLAQRWLPGLRQLCTHLVASRMLRADGIGQRPGFTPRLQPLLRPLGEAVGALRRKAIAAYATQWPDFAVSVEAFDRAISEYAQRIGNAERIWIDDGVYGA
jgi:LmbE family N-acetylglucosaminyl deacetylase